MPNDPNQTADPPPRRDPGPAWMWGTAWSLQGAAVVAVSLVGVEHEFALFTLTGLAAGVPLLGLYWVLGRRQG